MSFIPYQVDYSVKNAAKTLGFSKKRVSFKFGFANEQAIREGLTGPACRGSEHELTFIWSLATGKRQLLLDNRDLHFSESGQNGWTSDRAWQHAFTLRDSSGKTYRVHFISQPPVKEVSDSHPFDVRIGGMSYFQFNPLYQLGTPRMVVGHQSARTGHYHHSGRDSPMTSEERQQMAAAKLASLRDIAEQERREVERKAAQLLEQSRAGGGSGSTSTLPLKREEESLISFDDEVAPPPPAPALPVTSIGANPNGGATPYFASSITLDPMISVEDPNNISNNNYNYRTQPGSLYGANPYAAAAPTGYAAAPSSYYSNPYAPTASYNSSTSTNINTTSIPQPTTTADSSNTALTPYQGGGGNYYSGAPQPPQPYVDATGRLSMGLAPQQQPPPIYPSTSFDYGGSTNYSTNSQSAVGYNLASPSAMSYGSAPSFAQPPKPQPQPQQQQQSVYGANTTSYSSSSPPSMAPNPFAPPQQPTPTTMDGSYYGQAQQQQPVWSLEQQQQPSLYSSYPTAVGNQPPQTAGTNMPPIYPTQSYNF